MDPAIIAVFIPIIALMIPIVAMLIKHQQQMAVILHGQKGPDDSREIRALREEVAHLRDAVQQQTIAMDSLMHQQRSSLPPEFKQER